jgi:hypothetical protein
MNTQMLANTEYFGCDVGLSWNQHPTTSAGDIRKIAINESDPRHGHEKTQLPFFSRAPQRGNSSVSQASASKS